MTVLKKGNLPLVGGAIARQHIDKAPTSYGVSLEFTNAHAFFSPRWSTDPTGFIELTFFQRSQEIIWLEKFVEKIECKHGVTTFEVEPDPTGQEEGSAGGKRECSGGGCLSGVRADRL